MYFWPDGSCYSGEWSANKISGVGKYDWVDGRRVFIAIKTIKQYVGEWLDNVMHGSGLHTWKDGRKYDGEYQYDKKHGFGTYTWADGRRYEIFTYFKRYEG